MTNETEIRFNVRAAISDVLFYEKGFKVCVEILQDYIHSKTSANLTRIHSDRSEYYECLQSRYYEVNKLVSKYPKMFKFETFQSKMNES